MNKLGVKGLAFLLAFIPMLSITSVLSFYFINGQLNDIDTSINYHGISVARHIANASEYGVFSGNHESLVTLLNASINDKDVKSLTITDKSGIPLITASNRSLLVDETDPNLAQNIRTYRQPIILKTTPIFDINDADNNDSNENEQEVIGWVINEITTARLNERQNLIISNAIYIILLGIIISTLLAIWIGQGLTKPISRLTSSVRDIERGNLDITVESRSPGEIGTLEQGVKSMLGKIRITQRELQEKVDETTSGLKSSLNMLENQNQELITARKDALLASEAKSRFLANMSHEIRTPMNGILGFVRLLKNSDMSKEQNEYLNTIDKSSNNLLALIDDILDISKVEAGKLRVNSISFNLKKCVEEIITLMTPAAQEKGLTITNLHYSDTPTEIVAPVDRINQILINYIGNAIKFSEHGKIVIRTMLASNDNGTDSIMISVTDQGIGISSDDANLLFSAFSQLDDSSTKQHGGTGLGLAISKSLAEAMGGEVGVESEAGHGSKFWFTFRYKSSPSQDLLNNNHKKQIPEEPVIKEPHLYNKVSLSGCHILIAEDNAINTKLIQTILEQEGVKTFHATNGEEAIELFLNNPIDIILMDIHMPVMNGIDATKSIRDAENNNAHTPIIGLTANAMDEDKIIFKSSGIDEILIKPIAIDDLLHEIKYWVKKYEANSFNHQKLTGRQREPNDKPKPTTGDTPNQLGINDALESSLRKMLIDELPQTRKLLYDLYSSQNWKLLKEQVHKLLGGVAYCEVPELRKAATSFQEDLKKRPNNLDNEFKFLLSEIDELLSQKIT